MKTNKRGNARKENRLRRDADICKLFNELYNVGTPDVNGKKVRMRLDDAIVEIAFRFYLKPKTVEGIIGKSGYYKE